MFLVGTVCAAMHARDGQDLCFGVLRPMCYVFCHLSAFGNDRTEHHMYPPAREEEATSSQNKCVKDCDLNRKTLQKITEIKYYRSMVG